MLAAVKLLAAGQQPRVVAKALPAIFFSANRITRSAVANELSSVVAEVSTDNSVLSLLFVSAGPGDQGRLRLDAELREIMNGIRQSTQRDQILINVVPAARPTDLINAFNRFRPNVLHISGHGNSNMIAFEDDNDQTAAVSDVLLKKLVAVAGDQLKLVVLNACESADIAKALITVVDAAIGMNAPVGDAAARVFAEQFYSSIGEGISLERAFTQAATQIAVNGISEGDTPKLYKKRGIQANKYILVTPE